MSGEKNRIQSVTDFSVLMSIHASEQSNYLEACFESLLRQSLQASEVVLVEDGPLPKNLSKSIERFRSVLPLISVKLERNIGLACALNEGLRYCRHEIVARMDTDDVCVPERFEKQVKFMLRHPDIDVLGAMVEEFDSSMQHSLGIRRLPLAHTELLRFARMRSPISHPTVMFKKQAVLDVGGYPPFRKAQDYALWSLMLTKNYRMQNMDEVLLKMRAGNSMMARRGHEYLKHELAILKFQRNIGFISFREYLFNYIVRTVVRCSPMSIKKILYRFAR
ncbi:Glycosyl transferase family 2 [Pseudomonas sp. NFACC23-1]|uniref:glycosyltransferase n=1 Tax=unclassified Pseudomonas TaxID=196821 RepID=UPI000886245C|nr:MULTISPECIES: glycosyltransferase [unclassified Pseudomonas]SDB07111.1 Glycosyl transferase family 2 [Pseudomonas sp. NFACC17-2]SEI96480.1 Glycosyl transferase family 2 [Pseudomonas sp. NFACC23-1]SFW33407.1 Glycosyl transferase family 2 [Pseudomonas sp. NFACC16-2]